MGLIADLIFWGGMNGFGSAMTFGEMNKNAAKDNADSDNQFKYIKGTFVASKWFFAVYFIEMLLFIGAVSVIPFLKNKLYKNKSKKFNLFIMSACFGYAAVMAISFIINLGVAPSQDCLEWKDGKCIAAQRDDTTGQVIPGSMGWAMLQGDLKECKDCTAGLGYKCKATYTMHNPMTGNSQTQTTPLDIITPSVEKTIRDGMPSNASVDSIECEKHYYGTDFYMVQFALARRVSAACLTFQSFGLVAFAALAGIMGWMYTSPNEMEAPNAEKPAFDYGAI